MYDVPDQAGRRCIVTGANSGTGKEAAARLAAAGASVVLAVRTPGKGEGAKKEILQRVPGADVEVRRLDLADLASVRSFAADILEDGKPLHTLINNAGVMNPPTREVTRDGFELQFGSNFLGPFLLTNLLLPRLLEAASPRVATMTSGAANGGKINYEDLQSERHYRPMVAYAQSKLADLLMSSHLATLSTQRGWPLLSTSAHPGYTRTNLLMSGPNRGTTNTGKAWYYKLFPSMDVRQGTDPILRAATDPTATQDGYYGPRFTLVGHARPINKPRSARTADAAALWSEAARLTGSPALPRT